MQTAATSDWNASGTSKLRGSVCPCLQHNTLALGSSSGIIKRATSWPRPKAIRAATKRRVGQIDWDWYAECWLVLQVTGPFLFTEGAATKRRVGQIDWDWYAECWLVLQVTGPSLFTVLC